MKNEYKALPVACFVTLNIEDTNDINFEEIWVDYIQ